MTEGRCTAVLFSFLLHGIVIAAVALTIAFSDARREGPITIDLNLVTLDGKNSAPGEARPGGPARSGKKEKTVLSRPPDAAPVNDLNPREKIKAKTEEESVNTGLHGTLRSQGGSAGGGHASAGPPGDGSTGVKTLNYGRPGGADERHFSFIREIIMQGILYPERARRMGWEGKVILSFVVRESGLIDDVKVVASSGFPLLDENARGTIARTTLGKKVPVRLHVLLPVEYKLR
jgi:protein TonB